MSLLSPTVGQHFAYAAGRTAVLQQILLSTSDKDRLLGAKDMREAEAILTELKLTNPIDQGLKKSDDILNAIEQWIRKEVEHMTPESKQPTFSILWMENDASLIAYLLKEFFGLTSDVSTVPSDSMTSYSKADIEVLVQENTAGTLPSHLVTFVQSVKEMTDPQPQQIDAAVTQYIANMQRKLARASDSSLIKRYVRHKIDVTNIRTALRLLNQEESASDHLIMGGNIDPKALQGDLNSILATIDTSSLPYELSEAIRAAGSDTNALEQALSKVTANDIAAMWNVPMSIEPVFAFAALANLQLKLLRVLLIGKRATMSPQEIKSILPPFLSASHYVL